MKVWYSPCKTDYDTIFKYLNENSILINNEEYQFNELDIVFTDIASQTNNAILEAYRENNELCLKVFRGYTLGCSWDTGTYQKFIEEVV